MICQTSLVGADRLERRMIRDEVGEPRKMLISKAARKVISESEDV